jgi:hypothetical protein
MRRHVFISTLKLALALARFLSRESDPRIIR